MAIRSTSDKPTKPNIPQTMLMVFLRTMRKTIANSKSVDSSFHNRSWVELQRALPACNSLNSTWL